MNLWERKTIQAVNRFPRLTTDANPRYKIVFTDGTVKDTAKDAQINYVIPNSEYQGVPLDIWVNDQGDVVGATIIKVIPTRNYH